MAIVARAMGSAAAVMLVANLAQAQTTEGEAARTEVPTTTSVAPDAETGITPEKSERRWYGWETLATDGAAAGIALMSGGNEGSLGVSAAIYGLGAPSIHGLGHGRAGAAFLSLGIRAALPTAGWFTGYAVAGGQCEDARPQPGESVEEANAREGIADTECEMDKLGGGILGALIGATTAVVLDAAWIARKEDPKAAAKPRWTAAPVVRSGGGAVSVYGVF